MSNFPQGTIRSIASIEKEIQGKQKVRDSIIESARKTGREADEGAKRRIEGLDIEIEGLAAMRNRAHSDIAGKG